MTARDNYAIRFASNNGHLEMVKFLSSLPGVDSTADDNIALLKAA